MRSRTISASTRSAWRSWGVDGRCRERQEAWGGLLPARAREPYREDRTRGENRRTRAAQHKLGLHLDNRGWRQGGGLVRRGRLRGDVLGGVRPQAQVTEPGGTPRRRGTLCPQERREIPPPPQAPDGGALLPMSVGLVEILLVFIDRKSTRLNSSHANISY